MNLVIFSITVFIIKYEAANVDIEIQASSDQRGQCSVMFSIFLINQLCKEVIKEDYTFLTFNGEF